MLTKLDALAVGISAWRLGAGRARKEDPVQAGAGIEMHAKPGDHVTAGQPLLTISEVAADCATGGMFCLDITPQGVSFELNLDSMARSGVRVNPRVLGLARRKEGS